MDTGCQHQCAETRLSASMSTVSEHAHRRTEAKMHKQGQQPISRIYLYSKSKHMQTEYLVNTVETCMN